MTDEVGSFLCSRDSHHVYRINKWGFFEFSASKIPDKYDDDALIRQYMGYAYGYRLINLHKGNAVIGSGVSEGLYRCVSQLVLQEILEKKLYESENVMCLDIACGVGRCVADIASNLPRAIVIGFDYSPLMIKYATDTLLAEGEISVDLREFGFGLQSMERYHLKNVFLAQADAAALPIQFPQNNSNGFVGFDLVLNQMLIDRILAPQGAEASLHQSLSVLKENGTLIFTCPYNWVLKESWEKYGNNRFQIFDYFEQNGLCIEDAFDGLVYRELIDPYGTHLELPVMVIKGRKRQE